MRNWLVMIGCASKLLPYVVLAAAMGSSTAEYHGKYVNNDYGFSVGIPAGLTGAGAEKSAPNHGFQLALPDGATLRVDASYDQMDEDSVDGFVQQMVKLHGQPKVPLSGLHAWEFSTTKAQDKRTILVRQMIARRDKGTDVPIIYTIYEETSSPNDKQADDVFGQLVRTFRVEPILSPAAGKDGTAR